MENPKIGMYGYKAMILLRQTYLHPIFSARKYDCDAFGPIGSTSSLRTRAVLPRRSPPAACLRPGTRLMFDAPILTPSQRQAKLERAWYQYGRTGHTER